MADSVGQKRNSREFTLVSVAELSSPASASPGIARFTSDGSVTQLQIHQDSHQIDIHVDPRAVQIFKLGPVQSICMVEGSVAHNQT
ncbi:hypothetical protein QN277_018767 [Acacia crassicarpa]|uniref:Probable histone-arginine methyltransferase CARM1-like N-terminal PH domain-containing protein n=1 Tax=Acacia crassicarpa TaxID=499986 RepID=A0AAE1JSF6_9FABA|nr:hypothetical protein QN277_018767 [Acacia crassicarpa]